MTRMSDLAPPAPAFAAVRLVALDVDGTVLTPQHTITDATRDAVADARARGVRVVLASSRSPLGLRPILNTLGLRDEWFIAYQGALVARWAGPTDLDVLHETRLESATARALEHHAETAGLSVGRYTALQWRVSRLDSTIHRESKITGERALLSSPDQLDRAGDPHKLLLIAGTPQLLPPLDALAAHPPTGTHAVRSHRTYLEITAAGVDKAAGLTALTAHLRISPSHTAAVGDGDNDVAMFAAAGLTIAMGQASPNVQGHADYITASNAQDGVAAALSRMRADAPDSLSRRPSAAAAPGNENAAPNTGLHKQKEPNP
jgi:Cof subfamily protein (haloacid dehalogenase superfamily)